MDGTFPQNIAKSAKQKNMFSTREVGVTHPDTPAFMRLTDSGDIQIMASDGLGIIINREHNSITIMANTIRFITTDHEGLAWNGNFFNPNATVYNQPALNPATGSNVHNVFSGAENYYNNSTTAGTTFIASMQLPGTSTSASNPSQDLANSSSVASGNTVQPNAAESDPNAQPFLGEAGF